jgi:hypothetical protein
MNVVTFIWIEIRLSQITPPRGGVYDFPLKVNQLRFWISKNRWASINWGSISLSSHRQYSKLLILKMVFNEKCSAGSKFNDIADKLPGREDVCIDVRILRLWKVPAFLNPTETSSIEMVLVDKKVTIIITIFFVINSCFCFYWKFACWRLLAELKEVKSERLHIFNFICSSD